MVHAKKTLRCREEHLAVFACVLAILLLLQVGIGYYQAKDIQTFIIETQTKQNDAAWVTYLSMAKKITQRGAEAPALAVFHHAKIAQSSSLAAGAKGIQTFPPLANENQPLLSDGGAAAPFIGGMSEVAWNVVSPFLPSMEPSDGSVHTVETDAGQFPPFEHTVYPVFQVPNWGVMHTPAEWDRHFKEMEKGDLVSLPHYDLKALVIPMDSLVKSYSEQNAPLITAKLVYSTRYYGSYDIDATEFTGEHPGLDIKLAFGTPINAIAGGRVQTVAKDENLGLYIIVEHRLPSGETFYSVYGHFDTAWVQEGQDVHPGQSIGTVGMTGRTTAPHLHFQVDRDDGTSPHVRFWPDRLLTQEEAERYTVNPIAFIEEYGRANQ